MTLKEKFSLILMQFWASDWEGQCEKIADEYAIGFAEWYEEEILAKGDYNMIDKSKIELLKIYKKEKGL